MTADIAAGKFIETAVFASNMYGTSVQAVRSVAEAGRVCLLEIDVQGAQRCDSSPFLAFLVSICVTILFFAVFSLFLIASRSFWRTLRCLPTCVLMISQHPQDGPEAALCLHSPAVDGSPCGAPRRPRH